MLRGAVVTCKPRVPATLRLDVAPPEELRGERRGTPIPAEAGAEGACEPQPQGRPSRRWADGEEAGSFLSSMSLDLQTLHFLPLGQKESHL